jgi:hypothetical protein
MVQHTPLPVAGYTKQSESAVTFVNDNKVLEEQILRRFDSFREMPEIDQRWLAIARTHIEQGFMAANRAVFKPERVALSDDVEVPLP